MSRIRIITITLLLVLLVSVGFFGCQAVYFNPQPEPPGQPVQIDELQSITNQLQVLQAQLKNVVPTHLEDESVVSALVDVRDAAQTIVDYADRMTEPFDG
jgi:hypothetical protein